MPKLLKLDRRYSGHEKFKFAIEYRRPDNNLYLEHREWLWATYGASRELDLVPIDHDFKWCWEYTQWHTRIYVKDQQTLNWFTLKWTI